jgi:hypothetical protein
VQEEVPLSKAVKSFSEELVSGVKKIDGHTVPFTLKSTISMEGFEESICKI